MAGGDAEKGGNLKPADEQEIRLADVHHDLTRGLKARHITMIAIGGAIGTGLIIGTWVLPWGKLGMLRKSRRYMEMEADFFEVVLRLLKLVLLRSWSLTRLLDSSFTSSCAPSVKWLLGFLLVLDLPDMLHDSATLLLGLLWDGHIGSS
jgi:hypothetical protein